MYPFGTLLRYLRSFQNFKIFKKKYVWEYYDFHRLSMLKNKTLFLSENRNTVTLESSTLRSGLALMVLWHHWL